MYSIHCIQRHMHTLWAAEANTRLVVSTWSRVSSKKKGGGEGVCLQSIQYEKRGGGLPPTLEIFNGRYSTPLSFVACCHVLSRIVVCKCFKTVLITSILLKVVQMSILIPGWGRGEWGKMLTRNCQKQEVLPKLDWPQQLTIAAGFNISFPDQIFMFAFRL